MQKPIPDGAEYLLDEYDAARFWSKVNRSGGTAHHDDPLSTATGECWVWTGSTAVDTYVRFQVHGKWHQGHRIAYRDFGGKIDDGLKLDHLCRNKRCVNPAHLEPVSQIENVQRGIVGNKTHCPSGHEYNETNTRIENRRGSNIRICKPCLKAQRHEQYLARKSAA